ncbi:hypothetical protein ABPG77_000002 [Micractinium sp. CCAP 211/92]
MSKLSPLLSLLALAAALQACHGAPVTEDGIACKMQRSEQAAAPGRSSGAGAATFDSDWLWSDLSLLSTLSDENFTDALASTEQALVIFYAPYSGHCKRARHALAAAAPDIRERHPHVLLAQDHNTSFGRQYAPRGCPMVCWFVNATLADDRVHSRSRDGFIPFVDEQMGERSRDAASYPAGGGDASLSTGDRQEL